MSKYIAIQRYIRLIISAVFVFLILAGIIYHDSRGKLLPNVPTYLSSQKEEMEYMRRKEPNASSNVTLKENRTGKLLPNVPTYLSSQREEMEYMRSKKPNASSNVTLKENRTAITGKSNESFYQSLRLTTTTTNSSVTFVLLVTYGRSGSSWLGEMIGQANNSFYVFEPLQKTLPQGYFREDLICFNNNTCRQPRVLLERHTTILTTLYRLFTCQISKLLPFFKTVFKINLKSSEPRNALQQCLKNASLGKCLKTIEPICSKTTHRILKTIRIPMELVNILMQIWPNLKIVHLIRDPRGITNSRLGAAEFSMAQMVLSHSQNLCSRMYMDVLITQRLQKVYPNRLKFVFYEALTDRPLEGARYIYKFLDLAYTDKIIQWVKSTTNATENTKKEYYGIKRSDVKSLAFSWRGKLDLLKVQVIDYFCKDVYSVVGYIQINSTEQLKSDTIPSRRHVSIDGFA